MTSIRKLAENQEETLRMRVSETVSPVKSVGTAQRPLYYPCSELSLYLGILTRVVWATFHILGSEGVGKGGGGRGGGWGGGGGEGGGGGGGGVGGGGGGGEERGGGGGEGGEGRGEGGE